MSNERLNREIRRRTDVTGRDTIAFRVHRAAWFNLVLNQFEDPSAVLATIIRIVEAAPSFSDDRERELSRLRRLG